MIAQAIYDKKIDLARKQEQAKTNDNARARINNLLDIVTLQSQLTYLLSLNNKDDK